MAKSNSLYEEARHLTYVEFPRKWVWSVRDKQWNKRKQGTCVGRIAYVHPAAGELYYLCLLLNHVKGSTNFDTIKTIDGIIHPTFQAACNALGLLGNNKEWDESLNEATFWATPCELRQLFTTIIIFCEVAEPLDSWNKYWVHLAHDIQHKVAHTYHMSHLSLLESEIQNETLIELELLFNKNSTSLQQFNLPMPTSRSNNVMYNRLLLEEMNYDIESLQHESNEKIPLLNAEQLMLYNDVINSVVNKLGHIFFAYGHGGTGKTFTYSAIINKLRSTCNIVLSVALSGIASLLLPDGRTAHSRFKIPIDIFDFSTCSIKKGTQLAVLIEKAYLIVWDEAPMTHKHCFKALDRSLRDIMSPTTSELTTKLFGGKTVLLGGDFRQILPVIPKGSRHDTVMACITNSYIWQNCRIHTLKQNIRLSIGGQSQAFVASSFDFGKWILDVGEGQVETHKIHEDEIEPTWIEIPEDFLIQTQNDNVKAITNAVYASILQNLENVNYLRDRAIITPKNETADTVNDYILSLLSDKEVTYYSHDYLSAHTSSSEDQDTMYPIEYLNGLKFSNIPHHELHIKLRTPIMLLRNINQVEGLCNDTRLLVSQLGKHVIEAKILTTNRAGNKVYILRIIVEAKEGKYPFILKRRQFPVRLCYCMTINKSQGQSLNTVGLYLPKPIFSHGQLYVALTRVTTPHGLRMLIEHNENEPYNEKRSLP